ncbi:MAG: recombinase RecT [Selenomonadaceae bacterium]|nr:recombinase RecT [Selenomonadaceae bacterium]
MASELQKLLDRENVKKRFNEVLGENAPGFLSALLTIYNSNKLLQNCDAWSILGAAGLAATLKLSITPSLGQAYVVPYNGRATFQIGFRGLIQLAHRTGKYTALHAGKVCEGELKGFNPITGEPIPGEKLSDEIVGYIAYMRLNNGFEKTLYMTVGEIEEHAEKFSQGYQTDKRKGCSFSPWSKHFEAMATKTVLKKLLNNWGILSPDLAEAIQGDQSVVDKKSFAYIDNGGDVQNRGEINIPEDFPVVYDEYVDEETGEVQETSEPPENDGTTIEK